MHRTRLLSLALLLALAGCKEPNSADSSGSTEAPDASVDSELTEPPPFDPNVRKGVLDNGLTWYIEPKSEPQGRVQLWMAVRVGSVHEDDDQQGLAHYVEHMAFNGTEHFPKNELIQYLEGIGTRFGAHLNAHTSFEETVYKLQVPTDDDEIVDKGFLVLRDWAGGLSFTDEEMTKERGVVLEEWRRSLGAGGRAREMLVPLWFHGARHAERLPIGTEDSLKGFELEAARRYYQDWYRPDLMAVFVVGDIDPDSMESKITQMFSDFSGPETPRERIQYRLPEHAENLYGVHSDPEQSVSMLQVITKRDSVEGATAGDYRTSAVGRLATSILSERLADRTKDAGVPFLQAGISRSRMTPVAEQDALFAVAKEGRVTESLEAVLIELERIKRHGVTEAELDRAKSKVLKSIEKSYKERAKETSRSALGELLRNFTNGETVPGIAWEWDASRRYMPGIGADEVAAAAETLMSGSGMVVVAMVPQKEGVTAPTEDDLKAAVEKVASLEIAPPPQEEAAGDLLASWPTPGSVVSKSIDEDLGAEVWTLSNGATVYVKPTDFRADQIVLRGFKPGGTSLAPDEDFVAAATAGGVRMESGVGELDAKQLQRWLAGRNVSVGISIGELETNVRGTTTPDDLEDTLKLFYARATAPRFDEDAFMRMQDRGKEFARNRGAAPSTVFNDTVNELLWGDHPRMQPWTEATWDRMDLATSKAFHEARIEGWGDATFVLVGNLDTDVLEPLAAKYLATLPRGEPESFADIGKRRAEKTHERVVRKGLDPQARVKLVFSGEFESTPQTRHALRTLGKLMSFRLREVLREDLGGTYSVGARVSDRFVPVSDYGISIDFQCDPARVEELSDAALGVVDEVLAGPADTEYATKIIEQETRSLEEEKRKNGWWANVISSNRRRGEPASSLEDYWALHAQVTPEKLHAAAKKYIDRERMVKVVLMPETKGE